MVSLATGAIGKCILQRPVVSLLSVSVNSSTSSDVPISARVHHRKSVVTNGRNLRKRFRCGQFGVTQPDGYMPDDREAASSNCAIKVC